MQILLANKNSSFFVIDNPNFRLLNRFFAFFTSLSLRLSTHVTIWRQLTHIDVVMMSLTCTLQKQAELLTSVGDDLVVKTMVPRFSIEVTTPRKRCVIPTKFVECLTDKCIQHMHIIS